MTEQVFSSVHTPFLKESEHFPTIYGKPLYADEERTVKNFPLINKQLAKHSSFQRLQAEMPGLKLCLRKVIRRKGLAGFQQGRKMVLKKMIKIEKLSLFETTGQSGDWLDFSLNVNVSKAQKEIYYKPEPLSFIQDDNFTISSPSCFQSGKVTPTNITNLFGHLDDAYPEPVERAEEKIPIIIQEDKLKIENMSIDPINEELMYKIAEGNTEHESQVLRKLMSREELIQQDPLVLLKFYEHRMTFNNFPSFGTSSLIYPEKSTFSS